VPGMGLRNIRLGSLMGIPVLVNPSWFVLFGITTWYLATQFYPDALEEASSLTHYAMAIASVLVFFASVVLHELAHSLVARAFKIPVKSITLFVLGGVAQITREAARPWHELLMAIAGPLMSLALGGLFVLAWWLAGASGERPIDFVLVWLAIMNVILGVFNLLPAFPMDGGRVFRAAVWLITGSYHRATTVAGWTGRGFAALMIGLGTLAAFGFDVWVARDVAGGVWFVLIGLFLENAARQSLFQNRLVRELQRYRAEDIMNADPPVVAGNLSVASLARGVLELNPRVCYFVQQDGRLAGILSGYQMREIPEEYWDRMTAWEAMVPSGRLRATARDRLLSDVLLEMETEELLHMPVVDDGRVIGVIARDRILGVLRQAGLLGSARA